MGACVIRQECKPLMKGGINNTTARNMNEQKTPWVVISLVYIHGFIHFICQTVNAMLH